MSATAKNLRDAYEVIRVLTTINVDRRHIEILPLDEVELDTCSADFFETVRKAHYGPKGRKGP